jgi:hypothetical protein
MPVLRTVSKPYLQGGRPLDPERDRSRARRRAFRFFSRAASRRCVHAGHAVPWTGVDDVHGTEAADDRSCGKWLHGAFECYRGRRNSAGGVRVSFAGERLMCLGTGSGWPDFILLAPKGEAFLPGHLAAHKLITAGRPVGPPLGCRPVCAGARATQRTAEVRPREEPGNRGRAERRGRSVRPIPGRRPRKRVWERHRSRQTGDASAICEVYSSRSAAGAGGNGPAALPPRPSTRSRERPIATKENVLEPPSFHRPEPPTNVRYPRRTGKLVLVLRFTAPDPTRTPSVHRSMRTVVGRASAPAPDPKPI